MHLHLLEMLFCSISKNHQLKVTAVLYNHHTIIMNLLMFKNFAEAVK